MVSLLLTASDRALRGRLMAGDEMHGDHANDCNARAEKSMTAKARRLRCARSRLALATAIALVMGWPVAAQQVVDGDTIKLDGVTYQLHGIDAPETPQICADGWPAGYEAEQYLGRLIDGKQISCMGISRNSDGEPVAICNADGVDLGAAMVTGGYAFAFVPYSARYISQEEAAMSARRGVHGHHCLAPWKWRAHLKRG